MHPAPDTETIPYLIDNTTREIVVEKFDADNLLRAPIGQQDIP